MAVTAVENPARQRWSLTQEALDGLLNALSPDRDAAGARYLEMRANLVRLFEWRGCTAPEDYADEVINRCARKLGEGEAIRDVATYSVGVARMLLKEMSRDPANRTSPLEQAPVPRSPAAAGVSGEDDREDCLRRCLSGFSSDNRDFILRYYQGEKGEKIHNRKGLERFYGLAAGTLRMRALRLREKLQECMERRLERKDAISL
jgi:DNA-directed RNA polymerase specialized sigma24 family protein